MAERLVVGEPNQRHLGVIRRDKLLVTSTGISVLLNMGMARRDQNHGPSSPYRGQCPLLQRKEQETS